MIRTHNHLVRERTLIHLVKLVAGSNHVVYICICEFINEIYVSVCLSVCLSVSECIFICLGTYLTFTIQLKDYTKNQAEVVVAKG